jgi:L-serine dehydratase
VASRALSHNSCALLPDGRHYVGFDRVVQTMKQTGRDLSHIYKETSEGGLAFFYLYGFNRKHSEYKRKKYEII